MKFPIKVLNPKSDADQITLLKRLMGRGFAQVPSEIVAKKVAEASQKNMAQKVKQALKKGERITVDDLMADVRRRKDFLEFCEKDLGLSLAFFEGLAEKAIKEGGK